MTNQMATIDVVLRDGSTVCLRRADQQDVEALLQFLRSLSPQSLYYRFLGHPSLSASRVLDLTVAKGCAALVAESEGRIVAFAGFYRDPLAADRAEVAFAVSDAVQGHGLGTRLLERLADIARDEGIRAFDAYVLGENRQMLDVFRDSGFALTTAVDHGVLHVAISLSVTERFEEKAAARSRTAATASMKAFFEPRVIAVIGANRERGKIGSEILHNLVAAGFTGTIVPVHPTAPSIEGLTAYPRVMDIPGPVDLAIIVVPATHVLQAVDDCIEKNVPAICVISAGFSECDAEGRAREAGTADANPGRRLPAGRAQLHGPAQHQSGRSLERDVLAGVSPCRQCRDVHSERSPGTGDPGLRTTPRYRHLQFRVGGQQSGCIGQRPHSVLGR